MSEGCLPVLAQADPCALHIRVTQTFRAAPIVYVTYTTADLAQMWHRSPELIRLWLSILRRSPWPPNPPYVRLHRKNWAVRWLEIRSDYAALMRAVFIDKTLDR